MRVQQGITTTELIVTLFIGALFILSGYQLYNAVNLQAGNAREMAEVSSVAYRILRMDRPPFDPVITESCTSPRQSTVNIEQMSEIKALSPVGRIYRCKPVAGSDTVRVTVEIAYGSDSPKRKVTHAIFVAP